jgi:uncharacterized protein YgbK (DUF1537 family)
VAVSTESRGLEASGLREAFAWMGKAEAGLIFKKIDSTLRGNAGVEIGLAAGAFGREVTIITPAFPAMGRRVKAGALHVAGSRFEPIDVAGYWHAQGMRGCAHVSTGSLAGALEAGTRFVSVDASSDADLDAIIAAGLASGRRVLWAGSAGLAAALARAVARGRHCEAERAERYAAVLFCIGSNHRVTLEQQRELAAARPVTAVNAETAVEGIAGALHGGRHAVLQVPFGRVPAERVRRLIGAWRGPLALSGGATARLVCDALGVREIRIEGEIAAGIPRGTIAGGVFDGLPVVTKSGGFGKPDALIQIVDNLTCATSY